MPLWCVCITRLITKDLKGKPKNGNNNFKVSVLAYVFFYLWNSFQNALFCIKLFRDLKNTSKQNITSGLTCFSSSTWPKHDPMTSPPLSCMCTINWRGISTISSLWIVLWVCRTRKTLMNEKSRFYACRWISWLIKWKKRYGLLSFLFVSWEWCMIYIWKNVLLSHLRILLLINDYYIFLKR